MIIKRKKKNTTPPHHPTGTGAMDGGHPSGMGLEQGSGGVASTANPGDGFELFDEDTLFADEGLDQGFGDWDTPSAGGGQPAVDRRNRHFRRVEDKNIITKAHEEANAIRENAQREGFEEGLQQAQAMLDELRQAMDALYNARQDAFKSAADDLSQMAVAIAERIIQTEVSCDPELVLNLVKTTVDQTDRRTRQLILKVHPQDVELVQDAVEQADMFPGRDTKFIVLGEEDVPAGSCLMETDTGMVDARFTTQLKLARRLLGLEGDI